MTRKRQGGYGYGYDGLGGCGDCGGGGGGGGCGASCGPNDWCADDTLCTNCKGGFYPPKLCGGCNSVCPGMTFPCVFGASVNNPACECCKVKAEKGQCKWPCMWPCCCTCTQPTFKFQALEAKPVCHCPSSPKSHANCGYPCLKRSRKGPVKRSYLNVPTHYGYGYGYAPIISPFYNGKRCGGLGYGYGLGGCGDLGYGYGIGGCGGLGHGYGLGGAGDWCAAGSMCANCKGGFGPPIGCGGCNCGCSPSLTFPCVFGASVNNPGCECCKKKPPKGMCQWPCMWPCCCTCKPPEFDFKPLKPKPVCHCPTHGHHCKRHSHSKSIQQGPVKRHLMNTFNGGSFPGSAPFNFPPNFPFVNGLPVRPQGFLQVPYQTGPLRFQ
ncbi:hypothetical protein OS493_025274 [Desmophyllum pertusum]|uniref:Uncharacterized protein n=1 Tax=Desmophyllum pertusum TaxID=174260 RepID=A0A9W9ZA64_9CNID|nr:hypothetical protein OS493_025274 [Desmophyllum pertusum]